MTFADGTQPVEDDELLYRRVPSCHFDSESGLSPEAFGPHRNDEDGLSLSRANYTTAVQVAQGPSPHPYYVAVLKAGQLRGLGLEILPDPQPHDAGHVLLPGMNAENRKADETRELKLGMRALVVRVEGPFHTTPSDE